MIQSKEQHVPSAPASESPWSVIPNPDPSNLDTCRACATPQTFAVRHRDGGLIRFYHGRTMNRQTAEKLKSELEQHEV